MNVQGRKEEDLDDFVLRIDNLVASGKAETAVFIMKDALNQAVEMVRQQNATINSLKGRLLRHNSMNGHKKG